MERNGSSAGSEGPIDEASGTIGYRRVEKPGEQMRRQKVVAELGMLALAGVSMSALMDEVGARVAEALSVEYSEVLELRPGGDRLLLLSGIGWNDGTVGQATVGANLESHAGYALISKGPVIIGDLRNEARFAVPPLLREHGMISGISTAISSQGRAFGAVGVYTTRPRVFTEDEARFLQDVSGVLGKAIERRMAEERTQRIVNGWAERAEAAERRFRLLAEASALLSASHDYATTLTDAVRVAVPALADWCFIDVVEADGSIHRLAMAHAGTGEATEELSHELRYNYPLSSNAAHGTPKVLRTGRPEMISEIDDALLVEVARDATHLRILRSLNPVAYMCVPLQVRRRLIGSMGFVSAESGQRYGEEDLTLADGLARCTALALDNALHHFSEMEIVRELIQFARQDQKAIPNPTGEVAPELTPRQLEVLKLLAAGSSAREIGQKLYRSEATVRNHIRALLQALGAHSQLEAIATAREMGIQI